MRDNPTCTPVAKTSDTVLLTAERASSSTPRRRPRSSQTTVSMDWTEALPTSSNANSSHAAHLKVEVAECIETKTITTTTTTKRSFTPMVFREARPLTSLDVKEYPLAGKPTPPELAHFSLRVEEDGDFAALDDDRSTQDSFRTAMTSVESNPTQRERQVDAQVAPQHRQRSPNTTTDNAAARRYHETGGRVGSPSVPGPSHKKGPHHVRSGRPSLPYGVSDKLRRAVTHGVSRQENEKGGLIRPPTGFLASPDASELLAAGTPIAAPWPLMAGRSNLGSFETPQSASDECHSTEEGNSPVFFHEMSSPVDTDSHTVFSSTVATPPITDADAEVLPPDQDADASLQQSIRSLHPPRPLNTLVAQDASLPSPRLSPTLQAADNRDGDPEDLSSFLQNEVGMGDHDLNDLSRPSATVGKGKRPGCSLHGLRSTIRESQSMLDQFDAMPAEMKSFMMYQFLRRCPRKTLHVVADVVNPALKRDLLRDLPMELTLHVLSYLDHRDLCRAARVSKQWRDVVDSNETGWKELFERDGFKLAAGELNKAIKQGWAWQDPVGPDGCERDLSLHRRLTSTEAELRTLPSSSTGGYVKLRSSKRKRSTNNVGPDRSKRRASAQDNVITERRAEGPNSAANAAALAVPDPQLGLPTLRKLHLYKSLYRRHYMIRQSWTSGKVQPSHVAFLAHARHVITCLQFDEDIIITGSDDMLIHVYDTQTGKLRRRLQGHEGGVWALQYVGNTLVSGSTDRSVRVWDIENGVCRQVFYGHTSTVRCLQILMPSKTGMVENGVPVMMPPKPLIITGSRDSQLRVWRLPEPDSRRYLQTGPPANDADCPYFVRLLAGHAHSVRAIAAHCDTLVSGSYDNTLKVWKISTGEVLHTMQGHSAKVYSVVLDIPRNRCISGSMDSLVKIWDLATGACISTLEGHSLLVGLLDLRDERLVSAAADSTLRIWDPETGRCQSTLTAHTGAITCFQHDGRKVISGSDRNLKMWDIRTGECIKDLLKDLSGVWQVRFDERRCVAAVQRDNFTYIEILDFGAVRDGKNPAELGNRKLLNPMELQRLLDEDPANPQ